jgi:hypothetical protein
VRDGSLKPKEGVALAEFYETVMRGYTYLSVRAPEPLRTAIPVAVAPPAEPAAVPSNGVEAPAPPSTTVAPVANADAGGAATTTS